MDFGNLAAALGPQTILVTDPQRLQQLVINLLTNAIKFVASSETREIVLRASVSSEAPGEDDPIEPSTLPDKPLAKGSKAFLYISVVSTL